MAECASPPAMWLAWLSTENQSEIKKAARSKVEAKGMAARSLAHYRLRGIEAGVAQYEYNETP